MTLLSQLLVGLGQQLGHWITALGRDRRGRNFPALGGTSRASVSTCRRRNTVMVKQGVKPKDPNIEHVPTPQTMGWGMIWLKMLFITMAS